MRLLPVLVFCLFVAAFAQETALTNGSAVKMVKA
jgi:hypothetical protein